MRTIFVNIFFPRSFVAQKKQQDVIGPHGQTVKDENMVQHISFEWPIVLKLSKLEHVALVVGGGLALSPLNDTVEKKTLWCERLLSEHGGTPGPADDVSYLITRPGQ